MSSSEWKETIYGSIPNEWELKKISDYSEVVTDYVANGSFASLKENVKYLDKPDIAVLVRLVDYNNNFTGNFVYIDEKSYDFLKKSKLFGGEIIISNVGANAGTVFKCPKLKYKMSLAPNSIMIRTKGYDDYFYYWLKSEYGKFALRSIISGSAQPKFNKTDFRNIMVPIPPISEQKAIASTLSCLDDKIELNNRINKKLEEMAQAIFKSWFVDFEPFQDGEFEESELGMIPKGWRVGTIGELISETLGGDWGKETEQGNYTEEVICIRGADIPEISIGRRGNPPKRYIIKKNLEKKSLSAGQIIIEISGGSPTQSTGRTALITEHLINNSTKPLICTNFCRALSFEKDYYSTFVYSLIQYLYSKEIFFLYENGTTGIKNLDTNNLFSKHLIILPDDEVMIKYKEIFNDIINFIYQNGLEIDKLANIRDTLLPKLMSGEIRVPIEEVQ